MIPSLILLKDYLVTVTSFLSFGNFSWLRDSSIVQVFSLYILFLTATSCNSYYILGYVFIQIFLFGVFLSIVQMEVFTAFLWLTEVVVLLVFLFLILNTDPSGSSYQNSKNTSSYNVKYKTTLFFICVVLILTTSYKLPETSLPVFSACGYL